MLSTREYMLLCIFSRMMHALLGYKELEMSRWCSAAREQLTPVIHLYESSNASPALLIGYALKNLDDYAC